MMTTGSRRLWVPLALIATLAINALANILPLNGQNTGQISDRFPTLVTPAGYVFSIWSVIYLGLIGYAVYQSLGAQRNNAELQRIAPWFVLSCIANIGWLLLWHYNFILLTLPVMLLLLVCLIQVYRQRDAAPRSVAAKWLVHVPFSIYLGWISVATIVNVSVTLLAAGWNGGVSADVWALIALSAGAGLGLWFGAQRGDWAYALVITWAFVGIAQRQQWATITATAALMLAAIVLIGAVIGLVRARPQLRVQRRVEQRAL